MNSIDRSRTRELSRMNSKLRRQKTKNQDNDLDAFTAGMVELTFEAQKSTISKGEAGPLFEKFESGNSNGLSPRLNRFTRVKSIKGNANESDDPTTPKDPALLAIAEKPNAIEARSPPKVQKMKLSVTEGTLTVGVSSSAGPTIDPSSGSGTILSLSGTEDQINEALKTLRYTAPKK